MTYRSIYIFNLDLLTKSHMRKIIASAIKSQQDDSFQQGVKTRRSDRNVTGLSPVWQG